MASRVLGHRAGRITVNADVRGWLEGRANGHAGCVATAIIRGRNDVLVAGKTIGGRPCEPLNMPS